MRIDDPQILAALPDLGTELRAGASMTAQTSLGMAGATCSEMGTFERKFHVSGAGTGRSQTFWASDIIFEPRHTSFAPDDIMLSVKLELPSKPFREILQGIRICNVKRRASQPLNQKSAGCIFKNPPGASAGRMIDELGLKSHRVGDADRKSTRLN